MALNTNIKENNTMKYINPCYKNNNTYSQPYYKPQSKPVLSNGEYNVYKLGTNNYLYTYKDEAVANLAGVNIELFNCITKNEKPTDYKKLFLYDRILARVEKINNK